MLIKRTTCGLLALIALTFAPTLHAYDATISWNDIRQRITGFGAGTGDANGMDPSIRRLPEPARTEVLDLLFDTAKGIGFTMIRVAVPYILQENKEGGVFDIARDSGRAWLMLEAKKRGADNFWGAPWTPPFWMKTEQTRGGGKLAPAHRQDYADYLSRYVRDLKSRYNIDIKAISVQNEPHFNPDYGGCYYSGNDMRDFVRDYLGPTFKRDGVKATIMVPETNFGQEQWGEPTLADSVARKFVGIFGLHVYEGARPLPEPKVAQYGLELWETETSNDPWRGYGDLSMKNAIIFAEQIHRCMAVSKTNAWQYFQLTGGGNPPIRFGNEGYKIAKLYYCIGNWSKFVRPGWYMMGATAYAPDSLYAGATAYRNRSTGAFAIVAVNWDKARPHDISFTLDGFRTAKVTPWLTDEYHDLARQNDILVDGGLFSVSLPALSVVTFTGNGEPIENADVNIDSFTVSPAWIAPGSKAMVSWSVVHASSVAIDNGIGAVSAKGSRTVSPSSTTTYTLTAQGPNGPLMRKATIIVQTPRKPENPSAAVPGLAYDYYEGTWWKMPDFDGLKPLSSGTSSSLFATVKGYTPLNYAIRYKGFIKVPAAGLYTFFTESVNGSRLFIGDQLVVDNDLRNPLDGGGAGLQPGFAPERDGVILLEKGMHAIRVESHHTTGAPSLEVRWQSTEPGMAKTPVPANVLYRSDMPAVAAKVPPASNQEEGAADQGRPAKDTSKTVLHGPSSAHVVKAYLLASRQEACFSKNERTLACFWKAWKQNPKLEVAAITTEKEYFAGGVVPENSDDCKVIARAAYGEKGIYLLFEIKDNAWIGLTPGSPDYSNDAIDIFTEKHSAEELYRNLSLFKDVQKSQLTETYMQLQVSMGGESPSLCNFNYYNPLVADKDLHSTPEFVLYRGRISFPELEQTYGIAIKLVTPDAAKKNIRCLECYIPWESWGGPNGAPFAKPKVGTRLAIAFGYNDKDARDEYLPSFLRWRNAADPYGTTDSWGDVEFSSALPSVKN